MTNTIATQTPRNIKPLIKAIGYLGIILIAVGAGFILYMCGEKGAKYQLFPDGAAGLLLIVAGGISLLGSMAAYFVSPACHKESRLLLKDMLRDKYLYLLIAPGIILVFCFSYLPMYGLVLAFKDFKAKLGIVFSPWVGWENFEWFFSKSIASEVIINTVRIGVSNLLICFPVPILLALLMNELNNKRFRRTVQSVLYLPHFVSWVIIYSLLYSLFSVTSGLVNKLVVSLGGSAFNLLSDPNKFRGMVYATNVWKEAGWGTIIYMAAIAGIDQEMYEAAYLDGANKFQQCLSITLPSIAFAITTLLILNVGSVLGANFDQLMNLRKDPTMDVSRVIDTYVYDMGVSKGKFGVSTAVGLFQQLVNCALLFSSNFAVKKMTGEGFF